MEASVMVLRRLRPVRRPVDPLEPWEREIPCRATPPGRAGQPYVPGRESEVPGGALQALWDDCALTELQQLLVIPTSSRLLSPRRCALTPTHVLGLGHRAIGLWVSTITPQVVTLLPLSELGAIWDRQILHYRRLSFHSASTVIKARYDPAARDVLTGGVYELRKRLAGPPRPLPATDLPTPLDHSPGWPGGWRWAASEVGGHHRAAVRLAHLAPRRGRPGRRVLAAVTSFELVLARDADPRTREPDHGAEAVYLSRERIRSIAAEGERIRIDSEGVVVELRVGEELATWLGSLSL